MKKNIITPKNTPDYFNEWRFSPAISCGDFIFVSGCTAAAADGSMPEGIVAQTIAAFGKIKQVLDAAEVTFENVIEMTTYHVDMRQHFEGFKQTKDQFICEPFPAWTAVGIAELASPGALVEIRIIAHR